MPQTREHLDILELLGIKKTILVINKCDLADAAQLPAIRERLAAQFKGSIMENAPTVCVSALTGQGIDELRAVITEMVNNEVAARDVNSIPRLPADRVFSLPGFGTIVTGTLISGSISRGDVLEIYPLGKECRVRSIQVHGEDRNVCEAGQRTALNISGVSRDEIRRGCVIAPPGSMKNTDRIDVRLRVLGDSGRSIVNRERLHLFTGTSKILCRALLLDKNELAPGDSGLAQLLLEEQIVVRRGDRFVVRFYSPLETIGGGVVLEPAPGKRKRFDQAAIGGLLRKESGSLTDVCELHIRGSGQDPLSLTELARLTAHSRDEIRESISELSADKTIYVFSLGSEEYCWHRQNAEQLGRRMAADIAVFHSRHPYRAGIRRAELRESYMKNVKRGLFELCLETILASGVIERSGGYISEAGYTVPDDETFRNISGLIRTALENAGCHFIPLSGIDTGMYPAETVRDILQLMTDSGELVRIADDIYTMKHFIDDAVRFIAEHFKTEEVLTFTQLRDHLGTSRKCARILIAYTDQQRITKKVGAETERVAGAGQRRADQARES